MVLYDKAYNELKSKYLVPLSRYTVQYNHLKTMNVKRMLLEKTNSVSIISKREYVFHLEEDYIYKALLGEAELFYIKKIIQSNDTIICKNTNISANWNIVTNYYNAFFAASLMLRLCYRGNIFLDVDYKKEIENRIALFTGNAVKMDSNYFYEAIEENGQYVLKLTKADEGTHEIVWMKMNLLIDEMIMLSRNSSDEYLILSSIKDINNKLGNTFPSKLRNRVNYQPAYGLEYIDNKLFQINPNLSWVDYLLNFCNTVDDNQIACYMYAYTKYMEFFCSNFISQYYEIKGKENGILKKINTNRMEKIEMEKTKFVF